jgi:hypothetical protein
MSRLSSIRANAIAVWCSCGHSQNVEVAGIVDALGDMTVHEAVARMRCSVCRARGAITDFRIVYVGGSAHAMSAGHGQMVKDED